MKTQLLLTQSNTLTPLAVHEKINLKGSDFTYPMSRLHDRIVRKDKQSGFSMGGLKPLHKMYMMWNGTVKNDVRIKPH